jgi:hypothetical protein
MLSGPVLSRKPKLSLQANDLYNGTKTFVIQTVCAMMTGCNGKSGV